MFLALAAIATLQADIYAGSIGEKGVTPVYIYLPTWAMFSIDKKNYEGVGIEPDIEDYIYLPKNEQKEVLDIKQSDLNEKNQLILEPAVLSQFDFSEWPIARKSDFAKWDMEGFFDAKITEDGKLVLTTDGLTTDPDEPDTLTLEFTRSITGSPLPLLPEGEGLMVNFRYELELNISE